MRVTGSAPHAYKEPELLRFDRHVLWLQPDAYLIADDLESKEPQMFEWLLHAKNRMEVADGVIECDRASPPGVCSSSFRSS